jgi:uncharacterized protein (TIGR02757 family)
MTFSALKELLDQKEKEYNQVYFIENDPISIPHSFKIKEDKEISAFFAAIFAWGQRKTIISKTKELMALMDNSPHEFMLYHQEHDLKRFLQFKHRTFNATDTLYFIHFLKGFYQKYDSLEFAFSRHLKTDDTHIGNALIGFYEAFFDSDLAPHRTRKHIASPAKKSACKRLSMFLRWMVRKDKNGVDLGLWNTIKSSQLICPLDIHVDRTAKSLGLLTRKQTDWQAALELTQNLAKFDPQDPVKYDFALFGMGLDNFI